MNTLGDRAVSKLSEGFNCSQSVLFAACDRLPFNQDTALRVGCGFGAGMGRKEEVCGAVTGAIMALGLAFGRGENEDKSRTETTYAKTRDFMDRFQARHGSCLCRTLLDGCDLLTEDGQRQYKARDLLNETCKPCVRSAGEILEDLLPRL